jgi:hypothetical protein
VRPNILLLVADDQAYCHWGFMSGHCNASTTQRCVSNMGCPGTELCVSDGVCSNNSAVACTDDFDCGGMNTCNHTAQLALNDLSCRNRQPRRQVKSSKSADSECAGTGIRADTSLDSDSGDGSRFKFDRSKAPCYTTQLEQSTSSAQLQPALVTLEVDSLAARGAVFPRAHAGGISCKPARGVLHFGKQQRHLQWFYMHSGVRHECYDTATSDFLHPAWGCRTDADCQAHVSTAVCGGAKPDATGLGMARSMAYWLRDPSHNHDLVNSGFCQVSRTTPCACPDGAVCSDCPVSGSSNETCVNPSYVPFLYGKGEVLTESEGGFEFGQNSGEPLIGKFLCTSDAFESTATCQSLIDQGDVPLVAKDDPSRGVLPVTRGLQRVLSVANGGSQQMAPFFLWYAPKIPHASEQPEQEFKARYYRGVEDVSSDSARTHFGRVSWFDRGVAALDEYLKTTCVCGRNARTHAPENQSLFENTIVIALADQGFYLPHAKFTSADTTHRTPIVISTPSHRTGTTVSKVFGHEFAHEVDIMPTVLAFGGKGNTCSTNADCASDESCQCVSGSGAGCSPKFCVYAYGRNLRPVIEGAGGHLREVQFGQHGNNEIAESAQFNDHPYLIPRPGVLGVCGGDLSQYPGDATTSADGANGGVGFRHRKPCLSAGDCQSSDCEIPDRGGKKVCANRPDTVCATDHDCADPSICDGANHVCLYNPQLGTYADFATYKPALSATTTTIPGETPPAPHVCHTNTPEECLPAGVCQPLVLKIQGIATGSTVQGISNAWDLNYDPDQKFDLVKFGLLPADAAPDTSKLYTKLRGCLADFWQIDGTSKHSTVGSQATGSQASGCPWAASDP